MLAHAHSHFAIHAIDLILDVDEFPKGYSSASPSTRKKDRGLSSRTLVSFQKLNRLRVVAISSCSPLADENIVRTDTKHSHSQIEPIRADSRYHRCLAWRRPCKECATCPGFGSSLVLIKRCSPQTLRSVREKVERNTKFGLLDTGPAPKVRNGDQDNLGTFVKDFLGRIVVRSLQGAKTKAKAVSCQCISLCEITCHVIQMSNDERKDTKDTAVQNTSTRKLADQWLLPWFLLHIRQDNND